MALSLVESQCLQDGVKESHHDLFFCRGLLSLLYQNGAYLGMAILCDGELSFTTNMLCGK